MELSDLAIVIFILAYFVVIFFTYKSIYAQFNFRRLKKIPKDFLNYDKLLSSKIPFYQKLDEEGRFIFINLLIDIEKHLEFEVIGEINLTKASKVLLLSPMAQISFGYRENVFLKVSKIKVYSGPFRLGGRGVAIKGAYHPQGILMYSWPDFLKGFEDYNDNFNLGLHECAHVLKFYLLQNKDYNDFIKLKLSKYKVQAQIVFAKMHQDSESFLRQYAKVNMHEFFAVCVEHFYENPFNFKENLPDLYLSLKKNTQDRFD